MASDSPTEKRKDNRAIQRTATVKLPLTGRFIKVEREVDKDGTSRFPCPYEECNQKIGRSDDLRSHCCKTLVHESIVEELESAGWRRVKKRSQSLLKFPYELEPGPKDLGGEQRTEPEEGDGEPGGLSESVS
jgi:hypothetical protein